MADKARTFFNSNPLLKQKICFVFILFSFLIFTIYSNSLKASWQLDDEPNILNNNPLHIAELLPESLFRVFFAHPDSTNTLYRPLPSLTFALNWYFGGKDVAGYHIVNIIIHILAAFVLFHTTLSLFQTPALKEKYTGEDAYFISLLSTCLWAINPIQTQAVTYIVQRMAAMAALFYLLAIGFYINGRISQSKLRQGLFYLCGFISFMCALGSKENAAIFPFAIILVEIIFFNNKRGFKSQITSFLIVSGIGAILFFSVILIYSKGNLLFIFHNYELRTFSLLERLMTEPRVILFYLTLIFYPLPQRLSIDHDITISTSLFDPWTTLPAMVILFFLIIAAILLIKKKPILAFSILFFFLNHLIESTILSLEIIFEHRNYLPSAFIFLPVAAGFHWLINVYSKKYSFMYYFLIGGLIILLICLGVGTYTRNMAWFDRKTLWTDAATKAPKSQRPIFNLAAELGWKEPVTPENHYRALTIFSQSLKLDMPSKFHKAETIGNIGNLYYKNKEYQNAISYYEESLRIEPSYSKMRLALAEVLTLLGRLDEASKQVDILLESSLTLENYFNLKGHILLWQNRPDEALQFFRKALSINFQKSSILLNTGIALSRVGAFQNAEWFLNRAMQSSPGDMMPVFGLIENSIKSKNHRKAQNYARKLLSSFNLYDVNKNLAELKNNYVFAPISREIITPLIKKTAFEMTDSLNSQ
ncbi:MAG: hypothetical protein A2V65_09810 [Deltaproteobacteria bacterium RBG_13_49_15]|nr:MAG: hypothetical protein A2V65_09810 [Deltaproteobacteria bacterium RBG_13_49_15]